MRIEVKGTRVIMAKKFIKGIVYILIFFALLAGMFSGHMYIGRADSIQKKIRVEEISFQRLSDKKIKIRWSGKDALHVRRYIIKRKQDGEDRWHTLGTRIPDGTRGRRGSSYVDTLKDETPQQYVYRVDVAVKDAAEYSAEKGIPIRASNILLCIDPGHYEGQNAVHRDGIVYAEGDFTLQLAKRLKEVLEQGYGITSYLTRETGSVTLGGYTDGDLDNSHISLRGEYAKGSDLFLSLHTNANLEGANGYGTYDQPIDITKPIIIANTIACDSALALAVGNAVGERLAEANARMGIAVPGKFQKAERFQEMVPWTDAFNDGLEDPGTICYRYGGYGDYYGVLRGAADAGVPGLIIEHGSHTVPEMRQMAARGVLVKQWAEADAEGIAGGIESVLQKLWE